MEEILYGQTKNNNNKLKLTNKGKKEQLTNHPMIRKQPIYTTL